MPCGVIYSNRKSSDFGPPSSESQTPSTLSRNMLSAVQAMLHMTPANPVSKIVSNPSPWWTPLLFAERWRQNGQHPSAKSTRCVSIRNEVETRGSESYHLISMLGTSDNQPNGRSVLVIASTRLCRVTLGGLRDGLEASRKHG